MCRPCPDGFTYTSSLSCSCSREENYFNFSGIPIKLEGEALLKLSTNTLMPTKNCGKLV
eukprot:UN10981